MRCEESFYHIFIDENGDDHAIDQFKSSFSLSLSSDVYLFEDISLCPNSNRFIPLVSIYAITRLY